MLKLPIKLAKSPIWGNANNSKLGRLKCKNSSELTPDCLVFVTRPTPHEVNGGDAEVVPKNE